MRYRVLFLVVLGILVSSFIYADVPKLINFQGRLTDSSGKFVPDGDYSVTFRIYSIYAGGSAKWTESRTVTVSKGLFKVILGSVIPIPDSIFNYPDAWLGIQIESDPEMIPRQRLSSLGYSYRTAKADTSSYSMDSDKLDGYDATDFSTNATDYGRSGVASNLYEGTTTLADKYVNEGQSNSVTSAMITNGQIADADVSASANINPSKISGTAWTSNNDGPGSGLNADLLDGQQASAFLSVSSDCGRSGVAANLYEGATTLTNKYVNTQGPDSVYSTSNFGFKGKISGSSAAELTGVLGYSENTSSGTAYGGGFYTSFSGTGSHIGVRGDGLNASSGSSYGTYGYAYNTSTGSATGAYGYGISNSSGPAQGGYFATSSSGTGIHYGLRAEGYSASGNTTYGTYGYAQNTSTGSAYGGWFSTSSSGTGTHYGVYGRGYSSSSNSTYGTYGYGYNTSTGDAYGGYFSTNSSGTGEHYGLKAEGSGNSSATTYGVYGNSRNTSDGDAFGGYFSTDSLGTGTRHYGIYTVGRSTSSLYTAGVYGLGSSSSDNQTYGFIGEAYNRAAGTSYGGYFTTGEIVPIGTGKKFGVYARGFAQSDSSTYGVYGYAYNISTGDTYGGFFRTSSSGTGVHYGIRAEGYGSSSALTYGVEGWVENTSSGSARAGNFYTASSGTGYHAGITVNSYGSSSSIVDGVYSNASNTSSGNVYAGYFNASSSGTGTKYGVYASAPTAEGYAGYFQGNHLITGTKSAAVKVDDGKYHLLYSMESPENWFEDFGEAQMVNGRVVIDLDPLFSQTVNTDITYHVFLTPGGDCNGLYVVNKTPTSFEVRELKGGNSHLTFSYRIVAKRKGYEDLRLAKMLGPTPEEMKIEQTKRAAEAEEERTGREKNREEMETEQLIRPEMSEMSQGRVRGAEDEHSRMEAEILRMEKEREEEREKLEKERVVLNE